MEQQASEQTDRDSMELGALEESLRALWERAQLAAETVTQLRNERKALHHQVHELEERLRQAEQELRDAQEQLKTQPPAQALPENGQAPAFGNGEREALAGRVRDLLAKLDAYL
ncbi:MAG TPA: hypothetical protein VF889_07630 [Bacteroidota bacterium]